MSKEKKMVKSALCGLVIVLVAIGLLIPSCDAGGSSGNARDNTSIEKTDNAATEAKDKEDEGVTAKSTPEDSGENAASSMPSGSASASTQQPAGSGSGGNSGSSSDSGQSSGSKPGSAASKRWVPDYKQVWVEDSAAWSEQVPIYGDIEVSVCNVCGAEITGNEAAHAKQHALAGEGGGHHNDYRSVITGYETIHHEAVGHWETVEDGGHWEQ